VAALRAAGADYPEEASAEAPKPSKPRPAGTYDIGEE